MSMWIGKEKEGKHKGLKTLFIEGNCRYLKLTKVLEENVGIEQLYFGAGGCSHINEAVVRECIMKLNHLKITLEVQLNKLNHISVDIRDRVEFLLTVTGSGLRFINPERKDKYQIKIQNLFEPNRVLITKPLNEFNYTDINKLYGNQYEGDKQVF